MKRISVFFTFGTALEAGVFRVKLTDLRWLDPTDDGSVASANQVVVRIDAGNYELANKLYELANDVMRAIDR